MSGTSTCNYEIMNKKRVLVLGAGLVGSEIARDLHGHFDVTAADINPDATGRISGEFGIKTVTADLSDSHELSSLAAGADIIAGCLPGFMGYKMISELAPLGKDIVDISFFPEDPFTLDAIAAENGITVVTDCGVAPGMGNIILGYHNARMEVSSYECYVGGLPVVREWPWEYKAVFSPLDVIEEYTRPARYVENGHLVVREALSDPQLISFEGIGSLEAWNSDGLRTLIKTMQVPDMIEKTLRYPGCIEYLKVLREAGFFSYDPVDVKGTPVRPIDLTSALLFPKWKLGPGEEDFTVMRIIIKGSDPDGNKSAMKDPIKGPGNRQENKQVKYVWDLTDRYDKKTGSTSMARTTGYTCTAAVHLLARGMFSRKGICPPEYLGEDERNFRFIIDHLEKRGVKYEMIRE
ncbi:MAG: saccharopine dehydrogenase [Marinilabiliales bacterium]|nr:MAG: saccharopine dehydrogenase [Marinilabiliales bacterium]